jgi:hypothetical protein
MSFIPNSVSKVLAIGRKILKGTPGSILFVDSSNNLAQNSTKLFWDNTNSRLGVNTNAPDVDFHVTQNSGDIVYFDVGRVGASRFVFEIATDTVNENLSFEAVEKGVALKDFFLKCADWYLDLDGGFSYNIVAQNSNGYIAIGDFTTPASRLDVYGSFGAKVVSKTASYTAADETIILCDATAGAITITLPAASGVTSRIYTIKRTSASNNVIVDGNASETIDGATTKTLGSQYASITIVCNGSNWFILSSMGTVT